MTDPNRYKIGRHRFVEMGPAPRFTGQKLSYAVASNTDGVSIFRDGERGEVFQVMTMVDALNEFDGRRLLQQYKLEQGSIVEVRYEFQVYGDYAIDAVDGDTHPILKMIGSIRRADPGYVVEATWALYPVAVRIRERESQNA